MPLASMTSRVGSRTRCWWSCAPGCRSADPEQIFRVTTQLAHQLGLVGVRRVLDSAPLLDAVATRTT
jgi:hypothetical protein